MPCLTSPLCPVLSIVPTNERLRLEAGAVSAVMPPPHLAAATTPAAANITGITSSN